MGFDCEGGAGLGGAVFDPGGGFLGFVMDDGLID